MTDTLVDTNVILDVNGGPSRWKDWSEDSLAAAGDVGDLVVNQVVYAELASGYQDREQLDAMISGARIRREDLPWDAAFMAGLAFLSYRRRGGSRSSPLPDFFIGAHASVRGYRLLTRDRGYYANYFPKLEITSPETPA